MPKYDARCGVCHDIVEYTRSVSECMDTPECCGQRMSKVILTAPKGYVLGRFEAFRSPVDGSVISSKWSMDEHNKRNNVVPLADGYSDEKIRSGDFGVTKPNPKKEARELQSDIAEAYSMVKDGYKPIREVDDGD